MYPFGSLKVECFILTKWYVNVGIVIGVIGALIGFILTKWYVNVKGTDGGIFYRGSFILTKWYVNTRAVAIRK